MFSRNLVILTLCVLPTLSAPRTLPPVHKVKEPIAKEYIVILKDGVSRGAVINAFSDNTNSTSSVTHEWDFINGFAGTFSTKELGKLRSHPDVTSIEEVGHIFPQRIVTQ